jgi:hypothetical protein
VKQETSKCTITLNTCFDKIKGVSDSLFVVVVKGGMRRGTITIQKMKHYQMDWKKSEIPTQNIMSQ